MLFWATLLVGFSFFPLILYSLIPMFHLKKNIKSTLCQANASELYRYSLVKMSVNLFAFLLPGIYFIQITIDNI